MDRIKNTPLTVARQSLLVCAVALLTQASAQAQTNVNVVNTPTVRIDSRGNGVRVLNSEADPVKVRVVEEPFQVFLKDVSDGGYKCIPIPIPQGRVAVIEHIAASTMPDSVMPRVNLPVFYKHTELTTWGAVMYDIPLSEQGKGMLQLKLHVKGVNDDNATTGDVYNARIRFYDLKVYRNIDVIVSGRLLP